MVQKYKLISKLSKEEDDDKLHIQGRSIDGVKFLDSNSKEGNRVKVLGKSIDGVKLLKTKHS